MPTIGLGANRAVRLVPALAFALAIVAVVAFVWIRVALTLTKTVEPTRPIGTPSALGWGERVFTSKAELRRYLAARHIPYAAWAREHPSAIAVLEHRLPPAPAATTATTPGAPPPSAALPRASALRHDSGNPASGIAHVLLLLLPWAAFAALVALVSVPPVVVWERTGIELTPERRVIVGTVAAVLALGLVVARL